VCGRDRCCDGSKFTVALTNYHGTQANILFPVPNDPSRNILQNVIEIE
jgi:hypothetical protein